MSIKNKNKNKNNIIIVVVLAISALLAYLFFKPKKPVVSSTRYSTSPIIGPSSSKGTDLSGVLSSLGPLLEVFSGAMPSIFGSVSDNKPGGFVHVVPGRSV